MTQKRRDNHSTEFGLWLREQKKIESRNGFIASNIDYVWRNYKINKFMLIEEKRYGRAPRFYQTEIFKILDSGLHHMKGYCGAHLIIFENTNPDDGRIYIDGYKATKKQLIDFLSFSSAPDAYKTRFERFSIFFFSIFVLFLFIYNFLFISIEKTNTFGNF